MEAAYVPEPIFEVKSDTDLFEVYGPTDVDGSTDDDDDGGLQSMRIKLAVMKAKEKEDEDKIASIERLDADLVIIQELEEPRKAPPSSSSTDDRIAFALEAIVGSLTKLFEAIAMKLEADDGSEGGGFVSKRLREFEARFHRLAFEAKQRLVSLDSSELKLRLRGGAGGSSNGIRLEAFKKCLHRSLKSCNSLLLCYANYLTFSRKLLFPASFERAVGIVKSTVSRLVSSNAFADGGGVAETANRILVDSDRLSAAFDRFGARRKKSLRLDVVNELARKKFGDPPKTNLKRAEILGAAIKPQQHRVAKNPPQRKESIPKPPNGRSTKRNGIADTPSVDEKITKDEELKRLADHVMSSDIRQVTFSKKFLEIGECEARDIMKTKHRNSMPPPTGFKFSLGRALRGGENPMLLVAAISDRVVRDVVSDVCDEILSTDIISKLIQVEFGELES